MCRFIAANTHPDHDTIATFRRRNGSAFSAAFEHILLLASQSGLLKVGTVSVDGARIKANASKIKSIRYDRIQILRQPQHPVPRPHKDEQNTHQHPIQTLSVHAQ